jgi:hypothetical protein
MQRFFCSELLSRVVWLAYLVWWGAKVIISLTAELGVKFEAEISLKILLYNIFPKMRL